MIEELGEVVVVHRLLLHRLLLHRFQACLPKKATFAALVSQIPRPSILLGHEIDSQLTR